MRILNLFIEQFSTYIVHEYNHVFCSCFVVAVTANVDDVDFDHESSVHGNKRTKKQYVQ